jgi:hypothetical protein
VRILMLFTIYGTALLLVFCLVMVVIAAFCGVVRYIAKRRSISPRLMKWVDVMDWLKEEK